MDIFQTIIVAVVEGLTEFLPVSSTGHMIIAQSLLGVQSDAFVKAFTIIIQFAAILSVVVLYWRHFLRPNPTPAPLDSSWGAAFLHKWRFYWLLLVAFIPAAVFGLLFKKLGFIDALLENVTVVAVMLVVGGVFMLFCDRIFNKGEEQNVVNEKRAFYIGLFQCLAMIPGTSRSMATIVGGMAQKLTRQKAAEFSFFLAVPTMAAATGLDVLELFFGEGANTQWATASNLILLAIGCLVSFVVALLAMKWFVSFLNKYGFKYFGIYRIIVGGIILLMLYNGISLQMVD